MNSINAWLSKQKVLRPFDSEPLILSLAAMIVGLLSGVGVWLFKQLINLVNTLAFTDLGVWLQPLGGWSVALLPVLGGLIVGVISALIIGREKYHGLPGIIEACALAGGRLPYRKMPIRVTAAAISIGSGASVGPEDPSVQVGANIGSWIGQLLRLSEERTRALVAGGAAAGIAAAFNAPIAGVFFALEVLIGEISSSSFGLAAIASVISSIFIQAVSGSQPAFAIPQYAFNSIWELPLYLVLGMLAGPIAALYIRAITFSRERFEKLNIPIWLKPALAGAIVGITGIFLPQIFGVGYGSIELTLSQQNLPLTLLFILLAAKLILTPVSIGGGFVGGVFAPSLFLGAMLGAGLGTLNNLLFPALGLSTPAFALVGMAAVLAGTVHAPLTAILLLFEMTHDYRIILPLMFAVAVSLAISRRLHHESVYTFPLVKNGIRLEKGRDIDVLDGIRVSEVMSTHIIPVQKGDSLQEIFDKMTSTGHHGFPVVDDSGRLCGLITLQDIEQAREKGGFCSLRVADVCTMEPVTALPDETLGLALRRMSALDIGRLPVIDCDTSRKLIGMLRRSDVIHAYEMALARRAAERHHIAQTRLSILSSAEVKEVRVEPGSSCCGKTIKQTPWPSNVVISALHRGPRVILPHGDTSLQAGDVLVVVTKDGGLEEVRALCRRL